MQDFNEILENIKFFLQENKKKTIFICSLLIFMTFCALIVLSISGKKKKLPPIEPQKELVIDQKLLIPDGPVVPDGYITERKTQKNWSEDDIEKWFIDKVSAKNTNRPKLHEMTEFAREGDCIYIHDFSRLARSTTDLLSLVEKFKNKGITLISNKENIDTSTSTGELMLTMIAAINEFERNNLLERQREGIEIAKSKGVYKGRKKSLA